MLSVFIVFIFPLFLSIGIDSLHQHTFMKFTTELKEVVQEEGGVTSKVDNIIGELETRGYAITVKDGNGSVVTGARTFGDTIIIESNYKYAGVRGERELNTENVAFITRR